MICKKKGLNIELTTSKAIPQWNNAAAIFCSFII
jgi:hypothetical protein